MCGGGSQVVLCKFLSMFPNRRSSMPRLTTEPFMGLSMAVLAFNIITVPQLVINKICLNKYNASICESLPSNAAIQNNVQILASSWLSITPLISLLPGVFMMFMLGPFADIYGKRNTITLLPVVYFIQSIMFLVLASIKAKFSPVAFIFAACLSGMFGDNAGLELLCVAYLADTVRSEKRTFRVALLEASMFVGSVIASLLCGVLLQKYGFKIIFITTAFINFLNFIYVLSLLPDEKQADRITSDSDLPENEEDGESMFRKFNDKSKLIDKNTDATDDEPPSIMQACNPYKCVIRVKDAICARGIAKTVANILALMALAQISNMGELYTGVLFLKHGPFKMKPSEIGYLVATQSSIRVFGMITLSYVCQRVFKFTDLGLVIMGFMSQAIYLFNYGSSVSKLMLYLTQFIGLAASLHMPVLRSMMTKLVPDDQHGCALAAIEAVDVSSSIIACLVSNSIYSATVRIYIGLSLYILAIVALIGLAYAGIIMFVKQHREQA